MIQAFTLTDKTFCKLIKSLHTEKKVTHIKAKGNGNSMTPFLRSRETLFISPVDPKGQIKIGDIIAYTDETEEKIIVHRVINKKKNLFQIKGDNLKENDGWFPKKQIIGIVAKKMDISGKLFFFKRWENVLIAFISRTGLLNSIVLPFGRSLKQKLLRL